MKDFIARLGTFIISAVECLGEVGVLLYKTLYLCFTHPFKNFRLIMDQIVEIGYKSIPIVLLSATAIGMVMVVQLAYGFGRFGAKSLVGSVVSLAFIRELGPVLTSLLVGGRVGAGITAEIGSMKVTEQIDAMRTLGADPIEKLVLPRFVAALISFPLLAIIADLAGILGAMIISNLELGITPRLFISSIIGWILVPDLISGILKTAFFGVIVAIVGCYIGMRTEGGTQGVGKATTLTVVVSLVLIVIGDFLLTKFFLIFF
ncbi:MAG: MlaE family ABC transporter permease [Deltaproteobacteria bacterium]